MKDFLKTLGQFGMEGLGVEEERELSLEEEMKEEIAMEAELDEAYSQMEFANIVAGTSQAEAMLTAMADREVGLESNAGRDAATVYGEFGLEVGMEAVKDVVARKAYSGLASIKALINTCIKWLKSLLGIHTASKKIFAGLKKKATAIKKQLGKVQVKVSEKLKRDMPNYAKSFSTLLTAYGSSLSAQKAIKDGATKDDIILDILTMNDTQMETAIREVESNISALKDASERLEDAYDKKDSDEYEGSACYNHIMTAVKSIETNANHYKSDDFVKIINKNIQTLEKARKDLDKRKDVTPPTQTPRLLNKTIELYTKVSGFMKKVLKKLVDVADDALTMAKGIYATLV